MSSSTTTTAEGVIACPECDYLHRLEELPAGAKALCVRCHAVLYRHIPHSLERVTALYTAALMLFLLANAFPIIALKVGERVERIHLFSAAGAFFRHGMAELGVLVFITSILFPLITIVGTLYVLGAVRAGRRAPWMEAVFRLVRAVGPWSLVGVFMLGLLVAMVKLMDLATVLPGVSLFAYGGLLVVMAAASAHLDDSVVWPRRRPPPDQTPPPGTARQHGLAGCHVCALVSPAGEGASCPRCDAPLSERKHDAVVRTWALVVSAALLFIPANLYPVMTVTRLGRGEPNTILSGVEELIANGMWPLALLVFFASIVVPVAKLGVLSFLLVSVQRASSWRPRDRTLLFRVTEVVGAWSMVDVFLVAILTALVRMDALAEVEPGMGVTFFGAVVVLTMLAAHSFDPRLIWDQAEARP